VTKLFLAVATALLSFHAPAAQEPKDGLTEKETLEFCRRIELGVLEGKPAAFDDAIDVSAIIDTAIHGLDLKPAEITNFRAGVIENFSMGKMLVPSTGNSYRFLGLRPVGTHRGPMFRLWSSDGINYHVYRLGKSAAGVVRITDLFVFLNGDWMSSVFRQAARAILAEDPARRAKLEPHEREFAESLAKFRDFQRAAGAGEHAKALDLYASLPEGVRKMRLIQCLKIQVASKAGEAEFLKAEAEFKKLFPDDFSTELVTMDGFVYRKEYGKALASIDGLERKVGGDPLLNFLRGNMLYCMEKLEDAKKAGRQASKEVPYLQEPRWLLVTIALKEKAHAETASLLTAIEKDFKLELEDLTTISDYAEFVKSPEYRDWMKSRASK